MMEILKTAVMGLHLLWAVWMIAGVILSLFCIFNKRLRYWIIFRTSHLIALIGTATVPLWNDGICPLTNLEWFLEHKSGSPDSFLVRIIADILYWDIEQVYLQAAAAIGALLTIIVFILYPPWQKRRPEDRL